MTEKYVCGFCGKTHYDMDAYFECVSSCRETLKKHLEEEKQAKYLEELNAAINSVKQAKKYYEEKLEEFKTKYPKEYEINFAETCGCRSCDCYEEKTETYVDPDLDKVPDWAKSNSMEFSYENNGKDEPKMSAKLNGKELDDKVIAKLLSHPDVNCLAGLMNLL